MKKYDPFWRTSRSNHPNQSRKKTLCHFPPTLGLETFPAVMMCVMDSLELRLEDTESTRVLQKRLAQSGIASLRLDFRGCGDSEGSFEETDLESQISDALLGLNYLATHKKARCRSHWSIRPLYGWTSSCGRC